MLNEPTIKQKKELSAKASNFRKLSREDKLAELLTFCRKHDRIPRPFKCGTDEEERYLGNFYFNNKTHLNKYAAAFPASELAIFAEIETFIGKSKPRLAKLNKVLDFCKANSKIPSQRSVNAVERKLALSLASVKNTLSNTPFTHEEALAMDAINQFNPNPKKSKHERLSSILEFCQANHRTPRQHVADNIEKRMGEFFTTAKMAYKRNALTQECADIMVEILKFSPPTKNQQLDNLIAFISKNSRTPKTNSDDIIERRMAAFYTKMKIQFKTGTLTPKETEAIKSIEVLCNYKSRLDKIKDLFGYINNLRRIPKLNSNDSVERKNAMFLNNMKQLHKKHKLGDDESRIVGAIIASENNNILLTPSDCIQSAR